ncbi:uncharacterized protein LOC117831709 [Notolabrus celidotus]|uniref:uncharacterized protein LOC117831709 n=1 Tax=Notolabrus celidotus TaxID=1203425 RepID=UPI0014905C69|nr:uncharacterized protein LOC117831709 [Notolabrus celidotus]
MLIKTKINNEQKYVKITEPSLDEFLSSAFMKFSMPPVSEGVKVFDETGTEIDADVFEEVVQQPNAGVFTIRFENGFQGTASSDCYSGPSSSAGALLDVVTNSPLECSACSAENTAILELTPCSSDDTIILDEDPSPARKRQKADDDAKTVVESALTKKPGGDRIVREYNRTKSLTDSSRRQMINILTADMTETYGTSPPRHVRETYARGIVAMFPYLMDPYSKNGYEHFYDAESGSGYLAWRLKTIQRKSASSESRGSRQLSGGGPTARRDASFSPEITLNEAQCREAISFMKYSSDEAAIKQKMQMTYDYRRNMVLDEEKSSEVLAEFSRFKDIKGLIEQDFILQFGEDLAAKFLEKWPTTFKQKVIQLSKALPASSDLEELIHCAETTSDEEREMDDTLASGWDSDLSSIILLLHLIPPSAQGRKRPGKVSPTQAEKHLVVFKKNGTSLQEHVDAIQSSTQPYLLAVGMKRSTIHQFFIVLDKQIIPCKSPSSLGAFDELFKTHFVFGTNYNLILHNMYTFIQTTVYNIDIGKVQESPRVAEIRARMLH